MNPFFCYIVVFILMRMPLLFTRWVEKFINNYTSSRSLLLLYTILDTRRKYKTLFNVKQRFSVRFKFRREKSLRIINVFDESDRRGITDRFKGMILVADYCRKNGFGHKIFHKQPFDLEQFLICDYPNVSWHIDKTEYDSLLFLDTTFFLAVPHVLNAETELWVVDMFSCLYGIENLLLSISGPVSETKFSDVFNSIFKLSDSFSKKLCDFKRNNNLVDYCTITLRFANLLDEQSNEKIFEMLPEIEKTSLVERCIGEIYKIVSYPHNLKYRFFVTTDSPFFLRKLKMLDIKNVCFYDDFDELVCNHIAYGGVVSDKSIQKMMFEFFIISGATISYQIKLDKMYDSGFPRYAASVGNVKYVLVASHN